jgi:hypothetical protein
MDVMPVLFILGVVVIGVVLVAVIAMTQRGGGQLNREDFQKRWLTVERTLDKSQPASFQMAIFEADKLLDKALRERKFKGDTMGERMKSARDTWNSANNIWAAHKIRNRLAHETDVKLEYQTTARALSAYKQGLKDLGAI